MAIYNTVSIKTIIARIIRKTRLSDTSYLEDMKVWIPEAMEALKTVHQTTTTNKVIQIKNHIARLPCDLSSLKAVEYEGCRLRLGSNSIDYSNSPEDYKPKSSIDTIDGVYTTDSSKHKADDNYINLYRGEDLSKNNSSRLSSESYKITPGYIHTSFCSGCVTLHYNKIPLDSDGFPLVPDQEDYKLALEWYVYQQMVFSGYKFPDTRIDYSFCTQEYERHSRRAIGAIKYPSVDKVESTYRSTTRMIFPQHYWNHFGLGLEQIQEINSI